MAISKRPGWQEFLGHLGAFQSIIYNLTISATIIDTLTSRVEIFSHELHESHRGTHVRDIEHD